MHRSASCFARDSERIAAWGAWSDLLVIGHHRRSLFLQSGELLRRKVGHGLPPPVVEVAELCFGQLRDRASSAFFQIVTLLGGESGHDAGRLLNLLGEYGRIGAVATGV